MRGTWVLVVAALAAAPAAAGVCVKSSGAVYPGQYALPENQDKSVDEFAAIDAKAAQREECYRRFSPLQHPEVDYDTGAAALTHCLVDVNKATGPAPDPALEATAERVADAACTNDPGLFSEVHVLVYEDATVVDLVTLVAPAEFRSAATKLALAYGATPLREGAPVVVQVRPLRVDGEGRAFLRAVVRGGKAVTWLVRP